MSENKPKQVTTKEDLIRLIKIWPEAKSSKDAAERIGVSQEWVLRMVPLIRKAGGKLEKKSTFRKAYLNNLITEALAETK